MEGDTEGTAQEGKEEARVGKDRGTFRKGVLRRGGDTPDRAQDGRREACAEGRSEEGCPRRRAGKGHRGHTGQVCRGFGDVQGGEILPKRQGGVPDVHKERTGADRQQRGRKDRQALCPGKAELPLRQGKQRRRLLRRRHDDDRERKEQRIGASILHEVGPFGCLQRQCGPHVRQSGSAGLGAFGLQKEGTQEQDAVLCQIKQSKKEIT